MELSESTIKQIIESCACRHFKFASKVVSSIFEIELSKIGLGPSQFSILLNLEIKNEAKVSELAEKVLLDRSTLTRLAEPMISQGFIEKKTGDDKRTKMLRITQAGRQVLIQSLPFWKAAQDMVVNCFGDDSFNTLLDELSRTNELSKKFELNQLPTP